MDLEFCRKQLSANAAAIEQLVRSVPAEQACWRSAEDEWSILEVLYHLVDEEGNDFPFHNIKIQAVQGAQAPEIHGQLFYLENRFHIMTACSFQTCRFCGHC